MKHSKLLGIVALLLIAFFSNAQNSVRLNSYQRAKLQKTQKALSMLQQMMGEDAPTVQNAATLVDIDGNEYKTVKVGSHVWMAENLRVSRFQNGDTIPNPKDTSVWIKTHKPAFCDLYNNPKNARFGKLYNYYTTKDKRNIAPKGWHIATDNEWRELVNYFAGQSISGYTEFKDNDDVLSLKQNTGMQRKGFENIDELSCYWTSSANENPGTGFMRYFIYYQDREVLLTKADDTTEKYAGMSIRCVKNAPTAVKSATHSSSVKRSKTNAK